MSDDAARGAGLTCPKCDYVRTGAEAVHFAECPACGVVYAKAAELAAAGTLKKIPTPALGAALQAGRSRPIAAVQPRSDSSAPSLDQLANTTNCPDCSGIVSRRASACPHCGAPLVVAQTVVMPPSRPSAASSGSAAPAKAPNQVGTATGFLIIFVFVGILATQCADSPSSPATTKSSGMDRIEALTKCQMTLQRFSRDPETAKVPYVQGAEDASAYGFSWGASTKMMRFRNGLGLEVPVSAYCEISKTTGKILHLTIDGKSMLSSE